MKKVSVIVVTKNNENHIAKLLEALAYQDFKNFEVIIVDLCSTDKTLVNAKPYPVKVFRLESGDINIPRALNLASKICIGENIFCLKGNNIPQDINFISSGIKTLSRPRAVLSFGHKFRENEAPIVKLISLESWRELDYEDRLIGPDKIKDIHLDVCAFKKNLWQQYNFPDDEETSIWNWSSKLLDEGFGIYYNPNMAVITIEKTGLINYFREKGRRERLFSIFKERKKSELSH
ncbi:MAG: glycosyltransferase [Candidatus Berkelbacteria bacterium]|nr:glycosyltransferase [Candidatus Berkelbacteria bacterium]